MVTDKKYADAQRQATRLLACAGIITRPEESEQIEVVGLGLGNLAQIGLQILTIVSTEAIAVKVLILTPGQTFAQHRHPSVGDYPGKEETFRCHWGELCLYVPGPSTSDRSGRPPAGREKYYTVTRELVLRPGDQYTVPPNTWHWFQAGPEGAVAWSFSSRATDVQDEFTDPEVVRKAAILD